MIIRRRQWRQWAINQIVEINDVVERNNESEMTISRANKGN